MRASPSARGAARSHHEDAGEYVRDGRSPIPRSPATSKVMSANRSRDTGPERALRHNLWRLGVRGYRLYLRGIPGRPDISFPKQRVAVFVHGCFWHRCPTCNLPLPKSHRRFWVSKFNQNRRRDERKLKDLALAGWKSIVVWECEIRDQSSRSVRTIVRALHAASSDRSQRRRMDTR